MIRMIEASNIPECVEVITKSNLTVSEEFNITKENAPRYVAFSTTVERLEQQFAEGRKMYAYFNEKGKIIGYYSLATMKEDELELNNLCVLEEYRHHKIGEALFEHAISTAKLMKAKVMFIGIVEENQVLRRWYEEHGAIHLGTKKFDFFPFTCGYLKVDLDN